VVFVFVIKKVIIGGGNRYFEGKKMLFDTKKVEIGCFYFSCLGRFSGFSQLKGRKNQLV
jgi:hypothetical protein